MNNEELKHEMLALLAMSNDQILSHVNKSFAPSEKYAACDAVGGIPNPYLGLEMISSGKSKAVKHEFKCKERKC